MILRLIGSRTYTGSFYVLDAGTQTLEAVVKEKKVDLKAFFRGKIVWYFRGRSNFKGFDSLMWQEIGNIHRFVMEHFFFVQFSLQANRDSGVSIAWGKWGGVKAALGAQCTNLENLGAL